VKSTQDWLRELSEASEILMSAFEREKAARLNAESERARLASEQEQVALLQAQVLDLKAQLTEAKVEAEQAQFAKMAAEDALAQAKEAADLGMSSQQDSDHQSPSTTQSNQDRGSIRITPEFIDDLVNEIDACLMKLKH